MIKWISIEIEVFVHLDKWPFQIDCTSILATFLLLVISWMWMKTNENAYLVCFLRWSRLPNRFPHVWHGNGRCPVWMRLCRVSSSFRVNVLPQLGSSHLKGRSPIICTIKKIPINHKIQCLFSIFSNIIESICFGKWCKAPFTIQNAWATTYRYEFECVL